MNDAPLLICYDGSDDAQRAIDTAADLLGPRRAIVLDVGPPLTAAESLAVMSPVAPGAAFEELNEDDARQRARTGAEQAIRAGFDAEARADLAAPTWMGIVDVADELDAAVIVIGSRGLSGLKEVVEGSLSHQVAEHAGRPVLIAPPPHRGRQVSETEGRIIATHAHDVLNWKVDPISLEGDSGELATRPKHERS